MSLPKPWPKSFASQLALVNIFIISTTILGFAGYSAFQLTAKETELTAARMHGLAAVIVDRLRPSIQLSQAVDLLPESEIFKFYSGIESVIVSGTDGQVWSAIKRDTPEADSFSTLGVSGPISIPNQILPMTRYGIDAMEIWQPILREGTALPEIFAWLQVRYRLDSLDTVASAIMKRSLSIALVAITGYLILLRMLMYRPMLDLKKSAEFAEWLDHTQGGQLDIKCHAQEIQRLAIALNRTSRKLFDHEAERRSSAMLLTAIREIQTQFISELDELLLFTNVLDKITHLTQSDLGFIGAVKLSENDKPYIKMLAITDMSNNERFTQFEKKYPSKDLEFHNLHNLFGVILQTNKPTLANDPATDPRRGGLPEGHPPIHNFLGMPVFYGGQLVGVVAIANRHKGYDQTLVEYIQPLLSAIGHIMRANDMEHKRMVMQEEARESNIRLATILNTMADGVITFTLDGLVASINPAIVRMFGAGPDEIMGSPVVRFIPKLYSVLGLDNLQAGQALSEMSAIATTGICQDGTKIPVELNIEEFLLGEKRMFTLTVRDIAQRQLIEDNLRQSEQSLKQAQTIAHLGHWELNPQTKALSCSTEVYRMFGLTESDKDNMYAALLGRVYIDDRERLLAALDQALRTGLPFALEHRVVQDNGSHIYVSCQGEVQVQGYGQELKIVAVVQDITERKSAERFHDDFIASVNHELRTPLTSIHSALEFLNDGANQPLSDRSRHWLRIAAKNSERLLNVLNDLNDIDRIENQHCAFHLRQVDLYSFLQDVIDANRALGNRHCVQIKLAKLMHPMVVAIDPERMHQVFANVLSNAIRFSRKNGVVEIASQQFPDIIRITVTDHGQGIADEIKDKVFQMFSQDVDAGIGTGLGLNIAKVIVERHGGHMNFDSEEGSGSRFYLDLPTPLPRQISVA